VNRPMIYPAVQGSDCTCPPDIPAFRGVAIAIDPNCPDHGAEWRQHPIRAGLLREQTTVKEAAHG
jgi:hypothetical protein